MLGQQGFGFTYYLISAKHLIQSESTCHRKRGKAYGWKGEQGGRVGEGTDEGVGKGKQGTAKGVGEGRLGE